MIDRDIFIISPPCVSCSRLSQSLLCAKPVDLPCPVTSIMKALLVLTAVVAVAVAFDFPKEWELWKEVCPLLYPLFSTFKSVHHFIGTRKGLP